MDNAPSSIFREFLNARRSARAGALFGASLAVVGALAVMLAGALPAAAAPRTGSKTTIVKKKVAAPGAYTVMVSVAPPTSAETVDVSVGSQAQRGVPLAPGTGQQLVFFVVLKTRKLVVRATSSARPVHLTVAAASSAAASAPPTSGPYRNLVFSDDFTGPANSAPNPANWSYDSGSDCGAGTLSHPTSSLANASLDGNGNLGITALPDPANPTPNGSYTSAQLDTYGHFTFTYGRIEARMELPSGSGLCSAFWLLSAPPPGTPCPAACPEIDILEAVSPYPTVGFGSMHGPAQISNNLEFQGHVTATQPLSGAFHTWGVIWTPSRITWTLDGLAYATVTPSTLPPTAQWVFDTPMRILLDLAVGGFWALDPTTTVGFPASLRVDWVHVYQ